MSTQVLENYTITLWCYQCKESTKHKTVVKDQFTKKWRQVRQSPKANFTAKGNTVKYTRQCMECGNIVKF